MTISERIFEIMKERGISQMEFSKGAGIAQSTISDWKRKKTNPSVDKIMDICRALNVEPDELLSGTEQRHNAIDSIIVYRDTTEYEILTEMKNLKEDQLQRLRGYMEALKKNE
ncbi:MAG: helix-turn-helix transcriptional regulator [Lachnospiraceae bacterium]|nr:helix-turn-helix transcriptional regulator [Lachnospiraceae bacterium]